MSNRERIRKAAVAGLFYPGAPDRLRAAVDDMLARAPEPTVDEPVRALVSPHAGYPYSGAVAAHGFRALAGRDVRTMILIGPSHFEVFDYAAVFDGDAYETPLGNVAIDRDIAHALSADGGAVRASTRGHVQEHLPRGEHGLEVQLPFLQRVLPEARIVPVVMGSQSWERCQELADRLRGVVRDDVVVLASSDLSHFSPARRAEQLDAAFCDALETGSPRTVYEAIADGTCEACGAGPVIATIAAFDAIECSVLCRTHSGAVTGDDSSVVGYASAIVTSGNAKGAAS